MSKAITKSIMLLSLTFVLLATSISMVLADTFRYDYQCAGGSSVIDVPGQTRLYIIAYGGWSSDYGRFDMIQISVDTGTTTPMGNARFKVAVSYEDNPERCDFSESLGSDHPHYLVKRWQIQVFRIGKTSFVCWTTPLVIPATGTPYPTDEVVLPPGLLVLRGYGESMSSQTPPEGHPTGWLPFGTSGWYFRLDTQSYYDAHAFFFCPRWHYWGSVGDVEDFGTPRSVADRTWSWKFPN